jgi:hypothetical protein
LRLVDVVDLAHMFINAHPERFGYLDLILSRIDQLHAVPGEAVCAACGGSFGGALPRGYAVLKPTIAADSDPAWCFPLCPSCSDSGDTLGRLTELHCRPLFDRLDVIGYDGGPGGGVHQ